LVYRLCAVLLYYRGRAGVAGERPMLMGDPVIDAAIVILATLLILAFLAALWPMDRY